MSPGKHSDILMWTEGYPFSLHVTFEQRVNENGFSLPKELLRIQMRKSLHEAQKRKWLMFPGRTWFQMGSRLEPIVETKEA